MIRNIVNGFCMALADSVPGVSGGTVAFIMGFYENFIDALNNVFARDKNNMKKSAIYLGKMGIGWIIGILSSILLLSALFEKNIYFMSSLFFGLSLGAIPFILRSQWENIKGKYINIGYTVFGFVLVAGLSILRNSISSGITMDFASLSVFQIAYIFIVGMLAITAMVLPGISGSTLLLIFGVYLPTIKAVHSLMTFDLSVLMGVVALGLGVVFGMVSSVKLIRIAFKKYTSECIYAIVGLVAGSLVAIAYGPTTLQNPQPLLGISNFNVVGFVTGIIVLLLLELSPKFCRKEVK